MSPAAELQSPLLPGSPIKVTPASSWGAVFNVSTTIIGAGIMSIPATMKVLGLIPAFVLIVVIGLLAEVSAEFLLRFTHDSVSKEPITYAGLMRESFGKPGSFLVQISVIIVTLGCLTVYLIIIGDVFTGNQSTHAGVLQEWFEASWWNTRPVVLLFIVIFIILPLVSLKRVESLRFSSAISVLLALVFVVVCSVMAVYALLEGKAKIPSLLPQINGNSSFFDLFTAVPVIVTAFTFHFNVHSIHFELGKPSDMTTAVRISLILCAAMYFSIGVFGYLLFGNSIMSDILVNFYVASSDTASTVLLKDIVRLSYALHLVLVFPLLNFSLRANLDELIFPRKPQLVTDSKRFVSLTLILLVLCYIAAVSIPDIWYLFQFLGSTCAVCLAFIFPGAIVVRDVHGLSTVKDRIIATIMIILAVFTSIVAISTNIHSFFTDNS